MLQAKPGKIPRHERQQIMKSIIDFETRIYEKMDIGLMDLSPQNVIIRPDSLVFIDFEHAVFNRKPDDPIAQKVDILPGQYISPLIRWKKKKKPWPLNLMVTTGLIGNVVPGFEAEYAHTAHTITPEMREAYVVD